MSLFSTTVMIVPIGAVGSGGQVGITVLVFVTVAVVVTVGLQKSQKVITSGEPTSSASRGHTILRSFKLKE